MAKIFAVENPFGEVNIGSEFNPYGSFSGGVGAFLTNILRLVFMAAGVYVFINLIVAGFQYMTAAGDTKALSAAWSRIWQSLIGLVIVVGSFALAALLSYLIFGNAGFILNPQIYGPGQ